MSDNTSSRADDAVFLAAYVRAGQALKALLAAAGPGSHFFFALVPEPHGTALRASCPVVIDRESGRTTVVTCGREVIDLVSVLTAAFGALPTLPGGLLMRTQSSTGETVRGWRIGRDWLVPLTAGEVFNAYCTDPETGGPLSPEPGVDYAAGHPLAVPDDAQGIG